MKIYSHYLNAVQISILPSEFWISIHNVANCPILDKYENQMIRISLYTSHFLQKGAALSSGPLIYFKYNNHMQDRKIVLEESDEMRWDDNTIKG